MIHYLLLLSVTYAQIYSHPPFYSSLRVNLCTPKAMTVSYGSCYVLCQDTTVSVKKIDLQLNSLVWSYALPTGNNYTAVDLTYLDGTIYIALDTYLLNSTAVPFLGSTSNPRTGTYQGLLLEVLDRTGRPVNSTWIGNCFQGNSRVTSFERYSSSLYSGGYDDCDYGHIWISKHKAWITTENMVANMLKLSVIRQRIYVAVVQESTVFIARYEVSGTKTWLKNIGSVPLHAIKATEVSNTSTLDYICISFSHTVQLYNQDATLLWEFSQVSSLNLTSIIYSSNAGYILTGTISSSSLGYTIPSLSSAGISIWLDFTGNLLASRLYNSSVHVDLISTLSIYENEFLFLINSKESFYTNLNPSKVQSGIVFVSKSIFELLNCDSSCISCFGRSEKECYECRNYFIDVHSCGNCGINCRECSDASSCRECNSGYKLVGQDCVIDIQCEIQEYIDKYTSSCKPCHQSCLTCKGELETDCITCAEDRVRNDGYCNMICPSYRFNYQGQCLDCDISCERCKERTNSDCTECKKDKVIYKGRCMDRCPSNSYLLNRECIECDSACKQCTRPGIDCIECNTHYFRYNTDCINTCPKQYYRTNTGCDICADFCINCIDSEVCNNCEEGFYLVDGVCNKAPDCGEGMYFNSTRCKECDKRCKACYGNTAKECYKCSEEYFLESSSCENLLSSCDVGMYRDEMNRCQSCPSECRTCDSEMECRECVDGLYLYDGRCSAVCPVGYRTNDSVCQECPVGCLECKELCITCKEDFMLAEGVCVSQCPDYMYRIHNQCERCDDYCIQCTDQGSCIQCQVGYYSIDSVCMSCPYPCIECLSEQTCIRCLSDYVAYKGRCIEHCPTGTYNSSGVCIECKLNCSVCSSLECIECGWDLEMSGRYKLSSGICLLDIVCMAGETLEGTQCIPALDSESVSIHDMFIGIISITKLLKF